MTTGKKIYDPIHGFIRLSEIEALLVDSYPFQRLHYIRQLGVTYLVYPGATHTRFEHSLGVMHIASKVYDQIISKFDHPFTVEDKIYYRQVVRLAALSHDLGHLPFSHVAERRLLGRGGHEKWTLEVLCSHYMTPIWKAMHSYFPEKDAKEDVIRLALGHSKLAEIGHPLARDGYSPWHKVLSEIITGDYFGADRIDYLLRDSRCTGLSYGLFDYHQLMEMLSILQGPDGSSWQLGIEENGIESCEALLMARHFMYKRVYQYSSVKALSFHMSRFMKYIYDEIKPFNSLDDYLRLTDTDILFALQCEATRGDRAHPDAVSLLERSARFDYVELPDHATEEGILSCVDNCKIPQDMVEWTILDNEDTKGATFAVLKKNGQVVDAKECSRLIDMPAMKNFIYIPSIYSTHFQKGLFSLQKQNDKEVR